MTERSEMHRASNKTRGVLLAKYIFASFAKEVADCFPLDGKGIDMGMVGVARYNKGSYITKPIMSEHLAGRKAMQKRCARRQDRRKGAQNFLFVHAFNI